MAGGSHRKQYMFIFIWLVVLTALEVGIVYLPISRVFMITGLIGMALAKAALVALYYMHLNTETKILRTTVSYCLAIPVVYAIILIAEAGWRMLV